jgi:hypothetical protein
MTAVEKAADRVSGEFDDKAQGGYTKMRRICRESLRAYVLLVVV